jgi:hypothetical protein
MIKRIIIRTSSHVTPVNATRGHYFGDGQIASFAAPESALRA